MSRRALAALAALLLAVLVACGTGDGAPDAVRGSSADEPTTSTTATTPAATTTAASRPTSTVRGPTTTTARTSTTTSTVAGAKGLAPPVPGTYRYATSGATTFGLMSMPFPAVTTLVVDAPTGTVQHSVRDLRDPAGNGPVTELTLDYRPAGVYLVALKVTVGVSGVSQSQEFRPPSPVPLLATGAAPGAHSEADLPGGTGAKLVVDVLRAERVTVAGQGVDTLVMRAVVTLAPGDVTGSQSLTVNVDRTSRLWVSEQSVLDAAAGGGLFKLHSDYTANIQRLTP